MIEKISIAKTASYGEDPTIMNELSKINFIFGSNGAGKTTISRIIANGDHYPDCSISWKDGLALEPIVYNQEFIRRNFHESQELPGIFTLGEEDADTEQNLSDMIANRDQLTERLTRKRLALEGSDGFGGVLNQDKILEDGLKDLCWTQKVKYDARFKVAFEGFRNNAERFKDKILHEYATNRSEICDLHDLENRAETVFGESREIMRPLSKIGFNKLIECESNLILKRRVLGRTDIDIASLMIKLGNSDWVKAGRKFFDIEDRICPFCQRFTPEPLEVSLNEYFDETFEKDMAIIDGLKSTYDQEANLVIQEINKVLDSTHEYLESSRLYELRDQLISIIALNKELLGKKQSEPSLILELETHMGVTSSINELLDQVNYKVLWHNSTIAKLDSEKKRLTSDVWKYIIETDLKDALKSYEKKRGGLDSAIIALKQNIADLSVELQESINIISELEKKTTSVQPTVDEINRLLRSFGFHGFLLQKEDSRRTYRLSRPDGSDAKHSLSEGEKTFVTFLYFYQLLKGSHSDSGSVSDRIVVIDDPVSSLDSDILFIVSSLIKGLFEEVRFEKGRIKQVFILTHNIYFHKEITFNKFRSKQFALKDETFWIVRKPEGISCIDWYESNPIKTSYELLWDEVRNPNRSVLTIQNTLRRILENYFRILGGIDFDVICNSFDGNDRIISNSLVSWINDGSHSAYDELFVSIPEKSVDGYLRVFKDIFSKSGQIGHYNMMMRISE